MTTKRQRVIAAQLICFGLIAPACLFLFAPAFGAWAPLVILAGLPALGWCGITCARLWREANGR
jgi:hypothetical protein